jgi:hypothetical protein
LEEVMDILNVPAAPAVACDLSGVTEEQRARHRVIASQLLAQRREVKRDGDRWTVVFDDGLPLATIAEFVEFERRCCAFLEYDICGRGTSVCLELGGPAGSATLIEELVPLVRPKGHGAGVPTRADGR